MSPSKYTSQHIGCEDLLVLVKTAIVHFLQKKFPKASELASKDSRTLLDSQNNEGSRLVHGLGLERLHGIFWNDHTILLFQLAKSFCCYTRQRALLVRLFGSEPIHVAEGESIHRSLDGVKGNLDIVRVQHRTRIVLNLRPDDCCSSTEGK